MRCSFVFYQRHCWECFVLIDEKNSWTCDYHEGLLAFLKLDRPSDLHFSCYRPCPGLLKNTACFQLSPSLQSFFYPARHTLFLDADQVATVSVQYCLCALNSNRAVSFSVDALAQFPTDFSLCKYNELCTHIFASWRTSSLRIEMYKSSS
jgi:hypothetical protein